MTFIAEAVLVLIASPGDTREERAAIAGALNHWNAMRARRDGVVFVPWLYERHAVPLMGGNPQSIINAQAVDKADVVIALFDARLGTRTADAVSGTAGEIESAIAAGKRVHVYFSNADIRRDEFDAEQFAALQEFRTSLEPRGLLGTYEGPDDLADSARRALELDLEEMNWGSGQVPSRPQTNGAVLVAHHEHRREVRGHDKRGRPQYRTTTNRLVLKNESATRSAEEVHVSVEGLDDTEVMFDGPPDTFELGPRSERSWTLIPLRSGDVRIDLEWQEEGVPQTSSLTVSVPGGPG
ncbi:hypothetical protein GCM10023169_36040 [Georgenia halophila]|uniref:DUF4062 domain-containing protein n=1 Tax=Georgenia halophila TaxID=620889 RepID=A0ABP8LLR6_9MICO